jgi:ubiquinone/menaquinone biosynthesis C-methylase UbiE
MVTAVSTDPRRRWNHNIHYHRLVLDALPSSARTALDVGTGDGLLAANLREHVDSVTGIDVDPAVLERAHGSGVDVEWVLGDVMTHPLPEEHFDLVAAIATVHHLPDLAACLARLAHLTAPGGVVVVLGCARSASARDFAMDAVGAGQNQFLTRTRGYWRHSAPVRMTFPHTYAQVRRIAADVLPGVAWRRLPLFRYSLTWHKPV